MCIDGPASLARSLARLGTHARTGPSTAQLMGSDLNLWSAVFFLLSSVGYLSVRRALQPPCAHMIILF